VEFRLNVINPSLYSSFKIKGVSDGTLYRARVERSNGAQFQVSGRAVKVWETLQYMDKDSAIAHARYAIDIGKIRIENN
jgi:hypothetical protein